MRHSATCPTLGVASSAGPIGRWTGRRRLEVRFASGGQAPASSAAAPIRIAGAASMGCRGRANRTGRAQPACTAVTQTMNTTIACCASPMSASASARMCTPNAGGRGARRKRRTSQYGGFGMLARHAGWPGPSMRPANLTAFGIRRRAHSINRDNAKTSKQAG
jgi:hypothetical protein